MARILFDPLAKVLIPDEEKNVLRILNFSAKIKAGLKNIVLAKEKYPFLIYIVAKLSKRVKFNI